jgi:DNA-binding NtrC family response regulator
MAASEGRGAKAKNGDFRPLTLSSDGVPGGTVVGGRNASDALRVQCYRLSVESGASLGQSYDLLGTETRVGKASENNIVLDNPTVSRTHFAIVREGERYLLRDLGSTNGTFLDGSQVREAYLRPGALIEAGEVLLRFVPDQVPVQITPSEAHSFGKLVGQSRRMRELFALLAQVAPTEAPVVLLGETGTGKGTVAQTLHENSTRATKPFVVVDCASISKTLIESELFGHERGAFTGAVGQRSGLLELSLGGTLFLDQIEDLDLDLQPKLLRALEERMFRRVGGSTVLKFDARVVVASRKDLWAEVLGGRFREDLYFRLSVFTVGLPPLRDRKEDIPLLVDTFAGTSIWRNFPDPVRELFLGHSWPGNLRELRNAVQRAEHLLATPGNFSLQSLLQPDSQIGPSPGAPVSTTGDSLTVSYGGTFKESKETLLAAFEREYLQRLIQRCGGNIAKAAREADLDRKYLYALLKKYGLASE